MCTTQLCRMLANKPILHTKGSNVLLSYCLTIIILKLISYQFHYYYYCMTNSERDRQNK